ncbi:hypothetical protein [Streptomyces sp. NPDC088725]|uniref:DUF7144 family membrane protein n=1 Tax=Streptomyces sp. NPDC088725 TaxID=3365873 RepID=UPI00382F1337
MGAGTGTGSGTGAHSHVGRSSTSPRGGSLFASVVLMVIGATNILQGVAAVRRDRVFTSVSGYAYAFNLHAWGWIHVGLGVLLGVAALGILMRSRIARYIGIAFASLNLVAQFMWLPYQPIWAVVGMALSAFVIWALAIDWHARRTA